MATTNKEIEHAVQVLKNAGYHIVRHQIYDPEVIYIVESEMNGKLHYHVRRRKDPRSYDTKQRELRVCKLRLSKMKWEVVDELQPES